MKDPLPYIDFYTQHNVSPVTQAISKEQEYFTQRKYLYRLLGVGETLKTKKIIEFGPGNGVNAVFTNSLCPDHYTLVDGNPLAISNTRKTLEKFYTNLANIKITQSLIQEFPHIPAYDVVLCENLIPNQLNPAEFTKMISNNAKQGGLVVFTCNDVVSNLSETLRTLVGLHLTRDIPNFKEKVSFLSDFFLVHLQSLQHVARSFEDWIIDNILNLEWSIDASLFSMSEAVDALGEQFIIYNSSPRILTDLRWYRSVFSEETLFETNALFKTAYLTQLANLLDYRMHELPHTAQLGQSLLDRGHKIRQLCRKYIRTWRPELIEQIAICLADLAAHVRPVSQLTATSLEAYAEMLKSGDYGLMGKEASLINWWGRGTQYVSFIRELV